MDLTTGSLWTTESLKNMQLLTKEELVDLLIKDKTKQDIKNHITWLVQRSNDRKKNAVDRGHTW